MKCLRIFPETMPRISLSEPSKRSLNMALGNAWETVASISIGSDLATDTLRSVRLGTPRNALARLGRTIVGGTAPPNKGPPRAAGIRATKPPSSVSSGGPKQNANIFIDAPGPGDRVRGRGGRARSRRTFCADLARQLFDNPRASKL